MNLDQAVEKTIRELSTRITNNWGWTGEESISLSQIQDRNESFNSKQRDALVKALLDCGYQVTVDFAEVNGKRFYFLEFTGIPATLEYKSETFNICVNLNSPDAPQSAKALKDTFCKAIAFAQPDAKVEVEEMYPYWYKVTVTVKR